MCRYTYRLLIFMLRRVVAQKYRFGCASPPHTQHHLIPRDLVLSLTVHNTVYNTPPRNSIILLPPITSTIQSPSKTPYHIVEVAGRRKTVPGWVIF